MVVAQNIFRYWILACRQQECVFKSEWELDNLECPPKRKETQFQLLTPSQPCWGMSLSPTALGLIVQAQHYISPVTQRLTQSCLSSLDWEHAPNQILLVCTLSVDTLYSPEAEFVFPDVNQLKAGYCLCTSYVSPLESEIHLSRRILLMSSPPPDAKAGRVPLRRVCSHPAVKTAWKMESCLGILLMRPGRNLIFSFRYVYVPDGCLGWGVGTQPFCPRSAPTSHRLFPWLLFPRPGSACAA